MIVALIHFVIYLIVVGLILWLLVYVIDNIPLFEPFRHIARTVVMVIGVIILILLLLDLLGQGPGLARLRL